MDSKSIEHHFLRDLRDGLRDGATQMYSEQRYVFRGHPQITHAPDTKS